MERIATLFPESERSQYVEAARTARMPYWDWAIDPVDGQSVLPASVQSESVVIGGPNGTQEIGNPLHSYRFHPFDPVELATPMVSRDEAPFMIRSADALRQLPHFETWDHTIRAPSNLEPSAISQHAFIEELLASYRESNKPRLYNLFGRYTNFTAFSNSAWIINELGRSDSMDYENYDSIESLHDLIHGIIGLGGHMTVVDLSAFDPMFMLHHAMVDRVFAMWQAVHSTSYVQPEPEIMDSFTLRRGQIVDSTTPLSPFRDRTGNLWTSDSVKRTETFGYTYEDSRREDGMSDAAYSQKVVEIINVLYAPDVPLEPPTSTATESVSQPTASSSVLSSATVQPSLNSTVSEITTTFTTATSPVPPQPTTTTRSRNPGVAPSRQLVRRQRGYADPPKTHREYLAAVRASKSMLDKPFFVHLFLGNVPSTDPRLWISAPNRVGSHASFRSARHHGHAGIEQMTVAASIPITRHIMNRALNGEMAGLAHEEVLEYLKKNLKYRVVTVDGEVADRAAVNDKLSVEVVSGLVRQRASNLEFPKWDKLEKLCSLNATV